MCTGSKPEDQPTEHEVKTQMTVIDGQKLDTPIVKHPDDLALWRSIQILNEKHVHVVDVKNPDKGLVHRAANEVANFILLGHHE